MIYLAVQAWHTLGPGDILDMNEWDVHGVMDAMGHAVVEANEDVVGSSHIHGNPAQGALYQD